MCWVLLPAARTLSVPQRGRRLTLRRHNRAPIVMKMGEASPDPGGRWSGGCEWEGEGEREGCPAPGAVQLRGHHAARSWAFHSGFWGSAVGSAGACRQRPGRPPLSCSGSACPTPALARGSRWALRFRKSRIFGGFLLPGITGLPGERGRQPGGTPALPNTNRDNILETKLPRLRRYGMPLEALHRSWRILLSSCRVYNPPSPPRSLRAGLPGAAVRWDKLQQNAAFLPSSPGDK